MGIRCRRKKLSARPNSVKRVFSIVASNWLERNFPKAGWLMLFLLPGYPMCLLAGIVQMKRLPFILINLSGTVTRLTLYYSVSSIFDGPVGKIVNFINSYSLPFTVLMVCSHYVSKHQKPTKEAAKRGITPDS